MSWLRADVPPLDEQTMAEIREAIKRTLKTGRVMVAPPPAEIVTRWDTGPGSVLEDLRRALALSLLREVVPDASSAKPSTALQLWDAVERGPATHFAGIPVYVSRFVPAGVPMIVSKRGIWVRDQWRDLALPLLADQVRRQALQDLREIVAAAERRLGLS